MEKRFYDQGWEACCKGEPFTQRATIDWKDGWKDCNQAPEQDRKSGLESLKMDITEIVACDRSNDVY